MSPYLVNLANSVEFGNINPSVKERFDELSTYINSGGTFNQSFKDYDYDSLKTEEIRIKDRDCYFEIMDVFIGDEYMNEYGMSILDHKSEYPDGKFKLLEEKMAEAQKLQAAEIAFRQQEVAVVANTEWVQSLLNENKKLQNQIERNNELIEFLRDKKWEPMPNINDNPVL